MPRRNCGEKRPLDEICSSLPQTDVPAHNMKNQVFVSLVC